MTAAVFAFALAAPVYAETPQDVPGTAAEGNSAEQNSGALTAPEANKSSPASPSGNSMSDDPAANIPGTSAEGDRSEQNQTLSGADEPAGNAPAGSGESRGSAANIPGTPADGKRSEQNSSLSGSEKDKM
jgi:hypothetical protein